MVEPASVAMFVYKDAENDTRVWREAEAISAAGFKVTIFALGRGDLPASVQRSGVRLVRVDSPRTATGPGAAAPFLDAHAGRLARIRWLADYYRQYRAWVRAVSTAAVGGVSTPAIWYGHDLTGLWPAAEAHKRVGGPLVYDSHELFLDYGNVARFPKALKALVARIERGLVSHADLVIAPTKARLDELSRRYRPRRVLVVLNAADLAPDATPRLESPLRTTFALGSRPIVLYHGAVSEGRGIRHMVSALGLLPHEVAFVVLGNGGLQSELERLALTADLRGRLFIHPAVRFEELPRWIAGADMGLMTYEPTNLNNILAAPNKLFECMSVGIPVIASDFPAIRSIVEAERMGKCVDPENPAAIAAAVLELLGEDETQRMAQRVHWRHAAQTRYSWEHQAHRLVAACESLLKAHD